VALQPRKDASTASRFPPRVCFNGAVALQPRKGGRPLLPRLDDESFNGAVALQPRKAPTDRRRPTRPACFNGAVALQPRKVVAPCVTLPKRCQLQWGRGFAATEGDTVAGYREIMTYASMGPWLCSHGRPRSAWAELRGCGASMGPWLCSHGRLDGPLPLGRLGVASMGPWLCSHGWPEISDDPIMGIELQWGRGFAATEGTVHATGGTSNEQLQWGRGFAATEGLASYSASSRSRALQWGRGFAATEGFSIRATCPDSGLLQWGRGFAATEGRRSSQPTSAARGFNGAVALQPRKACPLPTSRATPTRFNGAVALQPRKAREHRAARSASRLASMGPWLCSHGRCISSVCMPPRPSALQWGRGFAATEGPPCFPDPPPMMPASMGPWLCSHGRKARRLEAPRGNELQWGRGFAATEGVHVHADRSFDVQLQWGRGFAATEGGSSEVISYQGPRVPFASTPAFLRLLPTFRIITVSVNRYIAAN
jgi:hypothetical protein